MISFLKTTTLSFLLISLSGCNLACKKNAGQAMASGVPVVVASNQSQVAVYHRSLVLGELLSSDHGLSGCNYTNDQVLEELGAAKSELDEAVGEVARAQNSNQVGESWASTCEAECSCVFYNLVMQQLPPERTNARAKDQIKNLSDNFSSAQRKACAKRLEAYCKN